MSRSGSDMFLPNVNLEEMVKAALWNVDYHLGNVIHFNKQPGMSTLWETDSAVAESRKPLLQADINHFHAHLRSFFWELVATFDTMEVWVKRTHGRTSGHLEELRNSAKADWYIEVSNYRNFAHRSFLLSQGLFQVNSGKMIHRSLISARKGGGQPVIPDSLVSYRNEMHKLFERIQQFPAPVANESA